MMNNNKQQQLIDTNSFTNEGMLFLHQQHDVNNDDTYYQEEEDDELEVEYQDKHQHQHQQKPYQGDDFRPTFYNPFEIKHRKRTSRTQFKVLEKTFLENPKPNAAIRRWLAQKLVMTPRGVQVWFQNRRAKEKTANSKKSPISTPTIITTTESIISTSEPMIKTDSNLSFTPTSPIHSVCTCNDCHLFVVGTPMTRTTTSTFYHSDASNADEEELLMTPITPFVDNYQQQLYDYPIFMNNNNNNNKQDWIIGQQWSIPIATATQQEELTAFPYFNNQQFDENRRFSQPTFIDQQQHDDNQVVFRRLSEPIFDHQQMLQQQFNYQQPIFDSTQFVDLLPVRNNNRYSIM